MSGNRRLRELLVCGGLLGATACGGAAAPASNAGPALPPGRITSDSAAATLVPANLGTLRQDAISIVVQNSSLRVTAIPLDETIIRTLAPDSYRSLRGLLELKRAQVMQRGQVRGLREPRVWYLSFYGLAPNAHFVPTDFTITSGGREYRPFDVIPITNGFGAQRLQPRETQSGLLLFDEGVDVNQPLVVTIGTERNAQWSNESILGIIEAERTRIRARVGRTNP